MDFMLMLVGVGGFVFITTLALLLLRKKEDEIVFTELEMDKSFDQPVLDATPPIITETTPFQMPVLDGSADPPSTSSLDMSLFPGWDEATVQGLLDQGWSMDQLTTYYAEQMSGNEQ
jgi:hypothetical protein